MTAKRHYAAGPDSLGRTHTRSSVSTGKTFTHAVVDLDWHGLANWCSRPDLAADQANRIRKVGRRAEILEARVLEKPLPSKNGLAL
jgi:hypothetical protein